MATDTATQKASSDDARVAGRGFLFITFAKLYFIATSTVVSLGLPRLFGRPALFGDFTVVNRLISVLNMVMIAGTIQAVSKAVSEKDGVTGAVRGTALRVQCVVGLPIFGLVFALSDVIAEHLLRDAALGGYLRIASLIVLFYSFYAIFVGLLNGEKRFRGQASLDVTFSTLKTLAIMGLVAMGFGVLGAFAGFAAAAAAILVISMLATRKLGGGTRAEVPFGKVLWFMAPVMAYTLLVYLLLSADNLLIKALRFEPLVEHFHGPLGRLQIALLGRPMALAVPADPALAEPVMAAFATHGTSTLSGFYGAMKNIANIPYQAVIAVTFVVFPLISRATFEEDRERTRAYISQTFRYSAIMLTAGVVGLLAISDELVRILFGAEYVIGGGALGLLLVAIVAFALSYVGNTIIAGAGRPVMAAILAFVTVTANIALIAWFLLGSDLWRGALEATALGTLVAMLLGLALVAGYLILRFRACIPILTALRVGAWGAAVWWGASFVPVHGLIPAAGKAAAAVALFLVGLVLTREFTSADIDRLRRVLGRGSGNKEAGA